MGGEQFTRSLLTKRRLAEEESHVDCSEYACVNKALSSNFKKIDKKAYAKLVPCKDGLPGSDLCESGMKCYIGGSAYYDEHVTNGRLMSTGFLKGAGDAGGGVIGVIFALIFMSVGLIALCKSLQKIFMSKAKSVIKWSTRLNDYLAILVGLGITIVVQSSSVTTSALTPLAGIGVLPLKKILPMTLGANIGTTLTAMIASLVALKFNGVQIAFAHLFFNIIGILIWFPVPRMRAVPLSGARLLGQYASYYRFLPALWIAFAFFAVPGVLLGVANAFYTSVALGVILLLVLLAALATFEFWWWRGFGSSGPGCFIVLSEDLREKGRRDLVAANAHMMGVTEQEYEQTAYALSWTGN